MSDKWEVVGSSRKRKPPVVNANGVQHKVSGEKVNRVPGAGVPKKPPKISSRTPAAFPFAQEEEELDEEKNVSTDIKKQAKIKGKKLEEKKTVKEKHYNIETALCLNKVPVEELEDFFRDLEKAGASGDVFLSWIKYCADALNSRINKVVTSNINELYKNLKFPKISQRLKSAIQSIITSTSKIGKDSDDVVGVAFSSLLASIPTLKLRGDPGWGYLIFLREICEIDPTLPIRRSRSLEEIMESYGNRKDIGLAILWTAAQAARSPDMLKIVMLHLLPFYNFKHYKSFIVDSLLSLSDTSVTIMVSPIDPEDFEEFFEAALHPKKRRDFEKFYRKIKEVTLKNIGDNASQLFGMFLPKIGSKDFMPLSHYGQEVFSVLVGCLENDSSCLKTWKELLAVYSQESFALLNHISKDPGKISFGKKLEKQLIQTEEFSKAAVETPGLKKSAIKFQVGFQKAEAAKRKFTWKMGCSLLIFAIIGVLWLDILENGNGYFEKSNTGLFLARHGLLDEAMMVIQYVTDGFKYLYDVLIVLFRSLYQGVQPLLQNLMNQIELHIPQLYSAIDFVFLTVTDTVAFVVTFISEKVFVGPLSPENLRRLTKDFLSMIWTSVFNMGKEVLDTIEKNIKEYLK